ncbi:MAG TPA: peptidylprolyl isomerase, partial [bacterium]|nr:peptidylprolyl isomerase [bacterium]
MTRTRGVIIFAATLAFLVGCGGGGGGQQKIVAKAGDIEITMADFQNAYHQISENNRPDISTLEGKRSFANDLLNQRILLSEAERIDATSDPTVAAQMASVREQQMLSLLYRDEVENKVDVLGADVKKYYDNRKTNVRASHILVDTVEEAQRIRQEIESGAISFEDAAAKYSLDHGTKGDGGELGELRWSATVPAFQVAAFELEPGVLSQPVETQFGVHLIKVHERIPVELGDFESVRISLRPSVRRDLEAARMKEFVDGLAEEANLRFHDDALRVLLEGMEGFSAQDPDSVAPSERYVPQLTPEQQGMVVASWDGGEWKISDHLAWLRGQPANARPVDVIPFGGLRELIRSTQVQTRLVLREAEKLGYAEREEVVAAANRAAESLMLDMIHSRFIQQADVPEEDVRALYDSTLTVDPDAFMIPERVDMLIIVQSDEAPVRDALKRLARGEDENAVIQ